LKWSHRHRVAFQFSYCLIICCDVLFLFLQDQAADQAAHPPGGPVGLQILLCGSVQSSGPLVWRRITSVDSFYHHLWHPCCHCGPTQSPLLSSLPLRSPLLSSLWPPPVSALPSPLVASLLGFVCVMVFTAVRRGDLPPSRRLG
jgi:hypothetical protein